MSKIEQFIKKNKLDELPFDKSDTTISIVEEVLEFNGYDVPKENRGKLEVIFNDFITHCLDFNVIEFSDELNKETMTIDALADINTFTRDAMAKLNYDYTLVMDEVGKHLLTRKQDPVQKEEWAKGSPFGKWQKWKHQPKKELYEPNYEKCKRRKK